MTQVQMEAIRKLQDKAQREGAKSRYATAVYDSVRDTLVGFCEQNAEFADAILQAEKTLGECCDTIMQKCGQSISDVEVYARAVNFYFPGAKVEMKMTVYMSEFEREGASAAKPKAKVLDLSLEQLLGLGGRDGKQDQN